MSMLADLFRYPSQEERQRGARRKLLVLKIIAGIMILGWIIDHTILAYWRHQMPP